MRTRIFSRETYRPNSWSGTITRQSSLKGLYLILDRDSLKSEPGAALSQAVAAGARLIQYRNKSGSRKDIYLKAKILAEDVRRAGAIFIVNDHADIALAVDADGVHLGQDDLPIEHARRLLGSEKIIGVSTHSIDQAKAAENAGADYIGFGPIYKTRTKDAGMPLGSGMIRLVKQAVSVPVFAIGGITQENIDEVMLAGADGAAVIGAVLSAHDIKAAVEEMIKRIGLRGKNHEL